MKATGRIFITAVLSIFIVTLAVESEARRGNYRGGRHLSRPGHFKSGHQRGLHGGHQRNFHRGHYKRSAKHRYPYGYYESSYKRYYGYGHYGYGAKYRYGHKRSLYGHKHYRPRLYYRLGYRHGFSLQLGHGLDGRYGYGKYHPFRYPHWRIYFDNGYKSNRYFAEYLDW
ncbi:MAG: hypothetical protein KJP05_04055 [Deltaproteobacteria bacterium]|nr:hypothetical protein [Deltaproteobacteria bacterium]